MPQKFNYFTQCVSIRNEGKNHDLVISLIYFKTTGNIICVSSSPRSKKVKKILWERFVQKEYHLCNTDENGWENYKWKYVTEVQCENSRKFDYYSEWIWDEKLLKLSRVWKNDQHGKVAYLQQLSISISLAQFQWVDGELGAVDRDIQAKKSTWKTEWSSSTRAEKFRFFTRCIFEESVSR